MLNLNEIGKFAVVGNSGVEHRRPCRFPDAARKVPGYPRELTGGVENAKHLPANSIINQELQLMKKHKAWIDMLRSSPVLERKTNNRKL